MCQVTGWSLVIPFEFRLIPISHLEEEAEDENCAYT
jgi:hypothetical protein